MNKILKIALLSNIYKDKKLINTKIIANRLIELGMVVLLHKDYNLMIDNKYICIYDNFDDLMLNCDLAITIGGDGTIIHFAKYASKFEKPVLGINLGRLGFVAGLEISQLDKLSNILSGDYVIQERAMLEVVVKREKEKNTFIALNDAVISRSAISKIIDISIYADLSKICDYRADGVIVSTPTGSTAYSLSAGGPVIEPTVNCMLITPICSHSIFARPMIFDNKSIININAVSREEQEVFLTIDGDGIVDITHADCVSFRISDLKAKVINLDERNFYKKLSEKFSSRT